MAALLWVMRNIGLTMHASFAGWDDGLGGLMIKHSGGMLKCRFRNVHDVKKAKGKILNYGLDAFLSFTSQRMSMNLLAIRDLMRDRSCGPCGVSSGWRQRRSADRSPQPRMRRASRRCDYTCGSGESWGE